MKTTRITNQAGPKITDPRVYEVNVPGKLEYDLFGLAEDMSKQELEKWLNDILPYTVKLKEKK